MKDKFQFLCIILILTGSVSCSPRHYHSCGFIENPSFEQFGASLIKKGNTIEIKSYIRSEMFFRTEYTYENLDIALPDTLAPNKRYNIAGKEISIRYAKGGQAGQLETTRARGTFTITEKTGTKLVLDLDLVFYDFSVKGHLMNPQKSISRKGVLTATKGYRLY